MIRRRLKHRCPTCGSKRLHPPAVRVVTRLSAGQARSVEAWLATQIAGYRLTHTASVVVLADGTLIVTSYKVSPTGRRYIENGEPAADVYRIGPFEQDVLPRPLRGVGILGPDELRAARAAVHAARGHGT